MAVSRFLLDKIKTSLENFPCVVLIGARQVGKTTLLKQVLPEANYYDLEKESDYKIISADTEYFLSQANTTLVIDEAQILPKLFNALRVEIDNERDKKGRFLLSGSSSPELLKNISESLAGRIAIINIPSFDWHEALKNNESDFGKDIFDIEKLKKLKTQTKKNELMELILHGTYPEAFLNRSNKDFYYSWQENYIKTYIERDIRSLFPNLNLHAYKRFISMLAFSSGEIMNKAKFASALDISEPTVNQYLEIVEGTFLWQRLASFQSNKKKTLIKAPKGYLKDTGLINYFLKITSSDQLMSHPNFGLIWEVFIIEQIQKSLNRNQNNISSYFYRSKNKVEVDLVLESPEGLLPIEIKSGTSTDIRKLSHLKRFIDEYDCKYGILINNGDKVVQLSEKIIQIPAIYL